MVFHHDTYLAEILGQLYDIIILVSHMSTNCRRVPRLHERPDLTDQL